MYKNKVATNANKIVGALSAKVDLLLFDTKNQISAQYRLVSDLLSNNEYEFKIASNSLDKASPLKILSKGYAKVLKCGEDVVGVDEVQVGDRVKIVLSDGMIGATVTDKE
ncbi:MAG: hypothetical protein IKC35_04425 [Clostridia bacterium]|nr:hypothetical protein [Clostridia bacterium]